MADKDKKTQDVKNVYAAIQQPAPLQGQGNVAHNWREWKVAFDYFLIASGKNSAPSEDKCALFMHVIGKYGREIFDELDIKESEKTSYEVLSKKFSDYCDPKNNVNFERHTFFETYQNDNNFEKFLGLLNAKSKYCEFDSLRSSLILTQLIRGLKDNHMRERLLAKTSLTLEEASQMCRAVERAGQQAAVCLPNKAVSEPSTAAVEQLRRAGGRYDTWNSSAHVDGGGLRQKAGSVSGTNAIKNGERGRRSFTSARQRNYRQRECDRCGYVHTVEGRCPASNVKCFRCDKVGHFVKCCRSRLVREIMEEVDSDQGDEMDCNNGELLMFNISIEASNDSSESWHCVIDVNGINVKFKLDSGADASVMSFKSFKKSGFSINILKRCNTILREISKQQLPVVGYFEALLQYKEIKTLQKIYVLDVDCNNLLGLKACMNLKLILRCDELCIGNLITNESIFDGIGCLPTECNIQIDESVPPVVMATRKIPLKLRPRLMSELDNMEKLNIIKKEDGPTDWVSSIVVVEKPNKSLRICLDPKNLNRAIKRSHFQLPTLDEIASNLSGAKYFSKCDAKNGFWMLKLSENSSKLCTFSTPFGRYRFLRMPFGISCAPEIFHNEMYKIFKMEGVEIYIDDVLIWGENKTQHDKRVREVLRRAEECGVKFNKEKCVFGASSINFLGHIFDRTGMKPDESRVKAIIDMPQPKDKKELERFLGVTNYLSRFIPRYSETSAPLRALLGKNILFEWCSSHDKAFNELKYKISSAPVLRYYAPSEPVTVSVDASSHGLGACLLQAGKPVAYAARTLSPTETRWAQIEKEMLAVVFGCTRFHQYIYGHCQVIVESDHKPLEAIFKKQLNEIPARLQRLMLKLQHYCITLQYKPGKLLFIADTLSRSAVTNLSDEDLSNEVIVHVNMLYESVEATPKMLNNIKNETDKDPVLVAVSEYYLNGWPDNKRDAKDIVKPYWEVRSELHVINGILLRNDRVVIPAALRRTMLERIHEGHLGVEKCQRRARDVMWWPGMTADIARVVLDCETCQRHRADNPREPLRPHAVPERPWEVLAADIFDYQGKHFLLVVDYYSKFVEVASLNNLYSVTVITAMKSMFSRFGIPKKVVTDNGPQFTSEDFKLFSDSWEFIHETSSPLYPRSNGLAERNIRTIKSLFLKAQKSNEEWQIALLNFRNTPITGEQYSPAQLLMSRRLNTKLPANPKILQPELARSKIVHNERKQRIDKYKYQYNKGTRNLKPLLTNQNIRMKQKNEWVKAKVIGTARGDRSYWVETENGGRYRRNRQHLMNLPLLHNKNKINIDNGRAYNHRRFDDSWEDDNNTNNSNKVALSPRGAGSSLSTDASNNAVRSAHTSPASPKTTRCGRVVRPPVRFGYDD